MGGGKCFGNFMECARGTGRERGAGGGGGGGGRTDQAYRANTTKHLKSLLFLFRDGFQLSDWKPRRRNAVLPPVIHVLSYPRRLLLKAGSHTVSANVQDPLSPFLELHGVQDPQQDQQVQRNADHTQESKNTDEVVHLVRFSACASISISIASKWKKSILLLSQSGFKFFFIDHQSWHWFVRLTVPGFHLVKHFFFPAGPSKGLPCFHFKVKTQFAKKKKQVGMAPMDGTLHYQFQSMRTGPVQGQIGPLLRRGFFVGNGSRGLFLSCPTPVLSGRISLQPITKLPSFLLKYFAVVLNYLPNEWILRGEAPGYWLRPVLSTRGEQLIPADDRKRSLLCHIAFLRKNRHLSLVPTLSG